MYEFRQFVANYLKLNLFRLASVNIQLKLDSISAISLLTIRYFWRLQQIVILAEN